MSHKKLTDKQMEFIAPHLSKPARTGRSRCDDRTTVNGIFYVLPTGCRWADMPKKYGTKSSAHLRFQKLQQKGVWKKISSDLIKTAHRQNRISLQKVSVDSSSIPAKKRK